MQWLLKLRSWTHLQVIGLICAAVVLAQATQSPDTDRVVEDFVALQRLKAKQAYKALYGDGLGLDNEPPPTLEQFVTNYVTEALTRETRRVLAEKGYDTQDPTQPAPSLGPLRDVPKKDAPVTLDGAVERLAVQKLQRKAVRDRVRASKPRELLEPPPGGRQFWPVSCAEAVYQDHVYAAVPGCSPGPPAGPPCQRLVLDDFISAQQQEAMIRFMDQGFQGLFHQGSETLLVPEEEARWRLGSEGLELIGQLLEKVRYSLSSMLNISHLFHSGSLLKRMDFPPLDDGMQVDPKHDSSNPHVDKANIASYDWSALLYFSTVGKNFTGGELVFNDLDKDRQVSPIGGRLLAFSSGFENLHRVLPLTWGKRYVLSMWFTCSEPHARPPSHPHTPAHPGASNRDAPAPPTTLTARGPHAPSQQNAHNKLGVVGSTGAVGKLKAAAVGGPWEL